VVYRVPWQSNFFEPNCRKSRSSGARPFMRIWWCWTFVARKLFMPSTGSCFMPSPQRAICPSCGVGVETTKTPHSRSERQSSTEVQQSKLNSSFCRMAVAGSERPEHSSSAIIPKNEKLLQNCSKLWIIEGFLWVMNSVRKPQTFRPGDEWPPGIPSPTVKGLRQISQVKFC